RLLEQPGLQGPHDLRVQLRPRVAVQFGHCDLSRLSLPVGPVRGDGIVRVACRDDAGAHVDLIALSAEWVAAAVRPLMMFAHDGEVCTEGRQMVENSPAGL